MTTTERIRQDPPIIQYHDPSIAGYGYDETGGHWDSPDWGPILAKKLTRLMTDSVTDGYHMRVAKGEIINNPCNMVVEDMTTSEGHVDVRFTRDDVQLPENYFGYKGQGFTWAFTPKQQMLEPDYLISDLERRSRVLALANISPANFEFGEDIGEIRETLQFLANPLGSLREIMLDFQWRKSRKARGIEDFPIQEQITGIASASASAWNEVSFAALPLARSIYDAIRALVEKEKKLPERLSSRGFAKAESVKTQKHEGLVILDESLSADVEFHSTIMYQELNPVIGWRRNFGLRNRDIPKTAWQLVPLSFMVDRMWDVSNMISALINLGDPGIVTLAASTRRKETKQRFITAVDGFFEGYTPSGFPTETVSIRTFVYDRQVWKTSVSDAIPPFDKRGLVSDVQKCIDLISIIISRST